MSSGADSSRCESAGGTSSYACTAGRRASSSSAGGGSDVDLTAKTHSHKASPISTISARIGK